MEIEDYKLYQNKVVIRIKNHICDTPDELLTSQLFKKILNHCLRDLSKRNSRFIKIFDHANITEKDTLLLIETFRYLVNIPSDKVPRLVEESGQFFRDKILFRDFIEYLYNYWRNMQRLIVCDSAGDEYDKRPYRTFNSTIEALTHLVRSTYRDIQENVTGNHPRIYRQVRSGAEIATIALPKEIPYPEKYQKLNSVSVVRQVLIYPPLIFTPPMNKRTGSFERVYTNPIDSVNIHNGDWLCYPAKVGSLLIMVYFSSTLFELGFSLSNLFEVADDQDLQRQPDAVYLFGIPADQFTSSGKTETIFYDDEENGILIGALPEKDVFGYFGYLKKMILTLHNIKIMKMGRFPYHGAMVNLLIRGKGEFNALILGDTGAGKSETLEALRMIASDQVEDMVIIADDMGSLALSADGKQVIGYGTETGAFVRLDDLQPGYAFGQIDRTIIMSPNQTNARVVLPVTTYEAITQGYPVDFVLYANNYDEIDENKPIIEQFNSPTEALKVFRAGAVMSKGTTSNSGLVQTYFANIFGPEQYMELHEKLAQHYFKEFFKRKIFVGQIRTRLGVNGWERKGPEMAAIAMLDLVGKLSRGGNV